MSCDGKNLSKVANAAMPPTATSHQYCERHGTYQSKMLGGNHNHPREANTTMLLDALCHRSTSISPTTCSSSSPIHPTVGDDSYHAPTWYPPNGEYHPPQSDDNIFTP